jgi:hypothetical protein
LMTILVTIGILLNLVSYRWMKHDRSLNRSNMELDRSREIDRDKLV